MSVNELNYSHVVGVAVKDTYQLVTQINGKEDTAAILVILKKIKEGSFKNDLKLLNYYHEVPVSFGAALERIDGDVVECTVHQAQAAALGLQKQTLLKSAHFPDGCGVHCFVEYINVRSRMAVLGRFAYATIRADRRNAVRVKVGSPVATVFQADNQSLTGTLKDISVIGLAVVSSEELPTGLPEEGVLKLNLMGTALAVKAVLVRSTAVEQGHLHTFRFALDAKVEELVSQFIYNRQVEIIRELKEHAE